MSDVVTIESLQEELRGKAAELEEARRKNVAAIAAMASALVALTSVLVTGLVSWTQIHSTESLKQRELNDLRARFDASNADRYKTERLKLLQDSAAQALSLSALGGDILRSGGDQGQWSEFNKSFKSLTASRAGALMLLDTKIEADLLRVLVSAEQFRKADMAKPIKLGSLNDLRDTPPEYHEMSQYISKFVDDARAASGLAQRLESRQVAREVQDKIKSEHAK
jgi:hypothetical protein